MELLALNSFNEIVTSSSKLSTLSCSYQEKKIGSFAVITKLRCTHLKTVMFKRELEANKNDCSGKCIAL